jgi:hypothetical protein
MLFTTVTIIGCEKGCEEREFRGRIVRSAEGQTYIIVDDDSAGKCGPMMVDGKEWPYTLHAPELIKPDSHVIMCGREVKLDIKKGTTFHFDFGPP